MGCQSIAICYSCSVSPTFPLKTQTRAVPITEHWIKIKIAYMSYCQKDIKDSRLSAIAHGLQKYKYYSRYCVLQALVCIQAYSLYCGCFSFTGTSCFVALYFWNVFKISVLLKCLKIHLNISLGWTCHCSVYKWLCYYYFLETMPWLITEKAVWITTDKYLLHSRHRQLTGNLFIWNKL